MPPVAKVDHITRDLDLLQQAIDAAPAKKPVDGGGGGGHNDGMEARVAKLEALAETTRDKIAGVETRLAIIEKTMATKQDVSDIQIGVQTTVTGLNATATKDQLANLRADLHKEFNLQTWRIIGALSLVVSAAVAITKFWH